MYTKKHKAPTVMINILLTLFIRWLENRQTRKFLCSSLSSYIKRFSLVFRTKIQRTNALKVKQASEILYLSGKRILGVKIHVNLLTFTAGRQTAGFHVLDCMWTTSRACGVAFKSSRSLPVVVHTPRRPRCLRSLLRESKKVMHLQL